MDGLNVIAKTTLDLFFKDNKMEYMFDEIGLVNKKGHTPRLRKTMDGANYTAYLFTIPIGLSIKDFEKNIDSLAQGMKENVEDTYIQLVNNQALITVKKENKKISYDYEDYIFENDMRIPLGIDLINKKIIYWDFTEPQHTHLILGGSNGSGKSTVLYVMMSHIVNKLGDKIELHLQDTKMVDLPEFKDANPVVYYEEYKNGIYEELQVLVDEMNRRYKLMKADKSKNIKKYNAKHEEDQLKYKFLVIEELASFSKEDVEDKKSFYPNLTSLLTKGRAAGIQVIFTCQTPYNTTFPGEIKNNVNTKIGLYCNTGEASKAICGDYEALTCLKGKGHAKMFTSDGVIEFQGFNIKDSTIERIVSENSKE